MQVYKLVLIGDKETGKTTYIKRLLTGNFTNKYTATLGLEVHPIEFNTNEGNYAFNSWDLAGDEKYEGTDRDGYYSKADACIAFYTKDSDNEKTDKQVKKLLELNPNAKLVIVWSKCDLPEECEFVEKKMKSLDGPKYIKRGFLVNVYQMSARSCYNYEKPLLDLLQKLTNNDKLILKIDKDI